MRRTPDKKLNEKKLIRAPEELVVELTEAAASQGKTFYRYVTEIFEQAIKAQKMGKTLDSIISSYELAEISKKTGVAAVPRDFLESGLEKIYLGKEENLADMWYQTGRLYGLLIKGKFDDDISAFKRLLEEGLWLVSEILVKREKESISLRFIAPSASNERSSLLLRFAEGVLTSLGFEIVEKNHYRGIVDIKITRIS